MLSSSSVSSRSNQSSLIHDGVANSIGGGGEIGGEDGAGSGENGGGRGEIGNGGGDGEDKGEVSDGNDGGCDGKGGSSVRNCVGVVDDM